MLELVIGDKQLSSWSMRAWLCLRELGLKFTEIPLRLDTPGFPVQIARYSPAARVPVLLDGKLAIWDSLAVCEYASELAGGRGWPEDAAARARARSLSAEMHSGFQALRSQWSFAAAATGCKRPLDGSGLADFARITSIWRECRDSAYQAGPWLFGPFSIVDAMYAPVALRCRTYGAILEGRAREYAEAVVANVHVREWIAAATQEMAGRRQST
jgi:glutathione S-transferase